MRLVVYSLTGCLLCSTAVAKYCVKLPTCEELGYIYSADKYPNNRSIKCPFDTKKILLLDYCQAYGLTSCDSTSGECDECIVEKADGTKSNSGYWRYTRCNAGYSYKSGECPPTEVDTDKYPHTPEQINESIGEIECMQSAQNTYCGYKSCNEGWDKNEGSCIIHNCDATLYPYETCDANGTCTECKSGKTTKYGEVTCNSGYYKIDNLCRLPCTTPGTCIVGDVYAYNNTPIGVVFANTTGKETKIIALTDIDTTGSPNSKSMYWTSSSDYGETTGITQTSDHNTAVNDTNGKYNTSKILSYASASGKTVEAATATSLYAPNVCSSDTICAKGNWHLPAIGELYLIYMRWDNGKIYQGLSSVRGTQFNSSFYWSSTENSGYYAWIKDFTHGGMGKHDKASTASVRPALHLCATGYANVDGVCI